eukprot:GHVN01091752.1.p1 GENE.GHVN01091752.1~~GHVN01091752.1.p1  ORF type:complete len:959 (+),score=196.86 GHVN01091752.1:151-3027(+)
MLRLNLFVLLSCTFGLALSSDEAAHSPITRLKPDATDSPKLQEDSLLKQSDEQALVDSLADNLVVTFNVVENLGMSDGIPCDLMGAEWAMCNQVDIKLVNTGDSINSKNWAIYFYTTHAVLSVGNDQFNITHITGGLQKLEPSDKFSGIEHGSEVYIPFIGEYFTLSESDFTPNAFVASPNAEPRVITSLNTEKISLFVTGLVGHNLKRTVDDVNVIATANSRFENNKGLTREDIWIANMPVVPRPFFCRVNGDESVDLSTGISIPTDFFDGDTFHAIESRAAIFGINVRSGFPVQIVLAPERFYNQERVSGAYHFEISPSSIAIRGFDEAGAFYAIQTLISLIAIDIHRPVIFWSLTDMPRFPYRGLMVDIARHMRPKKQLLATIDQLAAYKMNKLHLHLSDDEGWRLEIPGLPELTKLGAKRCFDLSEKKCLLPQLGSGPFQSSSGSGFLTRSDYIEILRYAKSRFVEVIPEFDMPAHSRAAVLSMEERYERLMSEGKEVEANAYRLIDPEDKSIITTVQSYNYLSLMNPCIASTYNFVVKVIKEVQKMHDEAGSPLTTWHMGGDEAKNTKLSYGYQDSNAANKVKNKGIIDLSSQTKPYEKSPMCQALIANGTLIDIDHFMSFFAEKVSEYVAGFNIPVFQAWEDGVKHSNNSEAFATEKVRLNVWEPVTTEEGSNNLYEWGHKGYEVIVTSPDFLYLDMPNEIDPRDRGYYWASRQNSLAKIFSFTPNNTYQMALVSGDIDGNPFTSRAAVKPKNVIGISAALWGETVRTDEQFDEALFPRLLAVAERAWRKPGYEREFEDGEYNHQQRHGVDTRSLANEYNIFANLVELELIKLDKANIKYLLPVPGGKIENGELSANVEFFGVAVEYSLDSGATWGMYDDASRPNINQVRDVGGVREERRHERGEELKTPQEFLSAREVVSDLVSEVSGESKQVLIRSVMGARRSRAINLSE